jgi:hypothetical protein
MRHKSIVLSLTVLTLLGHMPAGFAKDRPATPAKPTNVKSADVKLQSITLRSQTTTFTHDRKYPDGTTEKIQATVQYPIVMESVLKQISDAIELKRSYGKGLAEIEAEVQESSWLREISYETNYNRNGVLQLTYITEGIGAYPSQYKTYAAVDLHSGSKITANTLFSQANQKQVAKLVDRMMQQEIKRAIVEKSKSFDISQKEMRDRLKDKRFQVEDLQNFVIEEKGITFVYDFGFPHVALALEPKETYFVSYAQLKPYLQKQGVGARIVK